MPKRETLFGFGLSELGSKSLLYEHTLSATDVTIQILVLSPQAEHITEALARKLGHRSAEDIREKMRIALENFKHLAHRLNNIQVRCYDGTPNWKILILDDVIFVSSFINAKNDANAEMYQLTRESHALFMGLEKHFDELWNRSTPVQ